MNTASTAAVLFAFAFGLGLGTWLTTYWYLGQVRALKHDNTLLEEGYQNLLTQYPNRPQP